MKAKLILLTTIITLSALSNQVFSQKKYSHNAGKISYVITVNNFSANHNFYFTDFGKYTCIEVAVEIAGQKAVQRYFNTDNHYYMLDMVRKTYTKQEKVNNEFEFSNVNFDYYLKNSSAKELGSEMVLDKTCKVYSISDAQFDSKFWVWDNIVLKMVAVTTQGKVNYEAVNIEVSNSKANYKQFFEIPKDFKEVSMPEVPNNNKK